MCEVGGQKDSIFLSKQKYEVRKVQGMHWEEGVGQLGKGIRGEIIRLEKQLGTLFQEPKT